MSANYQPLDSESFLPENNLGSEAGNSQLKRLLLVDNQAHVLRVMKLSLDRNGFIVDTALSAEVALQMAQEVRYDVVIADAELAQMNGRDLLDLVSERTPHNVPLKLLLLDAENYAAALDETLPADVEPLEKPISLRWLVLRLSAFFGHYDAGLAAASATGNSFGN